MNFDWSPEQVAFRAELGAFADSVLPEHRAADPRHISSAEGVELSKWFVRELSDRGWLAPHWPQEFGGLDDTWRHIILGEEMWSRGEPRGPQYMNVNWIAPLILLAGTDEQKAQHLPRIRAGDVFWCQGFSEPEAGSDLASLRTRAVRDGDEYVIDGQKIWTSYAHVADFCFLLARTGPAGGRHDGISVFLLPMDRPGIEVREIPALAGEHQFHEVFLTDVRVPASCLLGEEGKGWRLVRQLLTYERVGSPRYAAAALALDELAVWARVNGVLDDPVVLRALGRARASCEVARLLTYRAMDDRAKRLPPGGPAYTARAAMVRAERDVATAAAATLGQSALEEDSIYERQLNSSMTAGVATGTYEVQLNLIARLCLGLPRR
ncbi:acyl-CoA dehydrogenase family protein [Capillimicrobium parvum]|uniref:Acyl-CoA dehydrogenase FadE17 n=1 Tax=Capillimicrobium parvum TaxID=2884022 RepID=A0A9E7BZT1_9ACTN|nr:acyl-CoA dehydrogenase family protein [Capillimicrobium parvum]UGS34827.1 Putative acyl-CoA dehydrogenase FadE17 [Capillimicrobium parvum]